MSWVEDRDKLIAETLEFVKQVQGNQPELAAKLQAVIEPEIKAAANPKQIVPDPIARALSLEDLRKDIRDRVDAFKTRQNAIHDEREQHYRQSLTRLRIDLATVIRKAAPKET